MASSVGHFIKKYSATIRAVTGLAVLLAGAFAYQNCSMDAFYTQSGEFGSLNRFSVIQSNANLAWTMKTSAYQPAFSRLDQVSRWTDAMGSGISIYPPELAGTSVLNLDASPVLDSTDNGGLLNFGPLTSLVNETGDLSAFLGQAYSFVLYVRNVQLPATSPISSRIFEFAPADGSESGDLGIDFDDTGTGITNIVAFSYFDANNNSQAVVSVPTSSLTGGFGMAVSFDNDPTQMAFSVNGQAATLIVNGAPSNMGNVTRQLSMHGAGAGLSGSFDVGELGLWTTAMGPTLVVEYSLAEQQSFDVGGSGGALPPLVPGSLGSVGAFNLIAANFSTCINCHVEVASRSAMLAAIGDDGVTPWVTIGNPAGSLIIQSLQHQSGADPMPKDLDPLSADQISQIASWIQQGAN